MSVVDFGVDCIRIFLSSCSNLLLRFLTKNTHEKMPTVRINSAAAAMVMPAIWAMVRFSWPLTETPSAPTLAVAPAGTVVVGGGMFDMADPVLVAAVLLVGVAKAVVGVDSSVKDIDTVDVMICGVCPQILVGGVVLNGSVKLQLGDCMQPDMPVRYQQDGRLQNVG